VRISRAGVHVFPRMLKPIDTELRTTRSERISTGVPGLDTMLGGGTLRGNAIMIAGPSGSGKSTLATQFIAEGVRRGEPGVIAGFEETPPKYIEQANGFGFDMERAVREGQVELVYLRPLDLSVDETLYAIQDAVDRVKARRVVIDSLTGLEIALAPMFKEDFRESMYRLLGALTGAGISIMMTVEITESYTELRFSPHAVSFMTHDIILQRYVEIAGELKTIMTVVKTRGRAHSSELRRYEVTSRGVVVGDVVRDYEGLITGVPRLTQGAAGSEVQGSEGERAVLEALAQQRAAATEATLRRLTGLPQQALRRILVDLTRSKQAMRTRRAGQSTYRLPKTQRRD
jgi:circadian clock protein KaiC